MTTNYITIIGSNFGLSPSVLITGGPTCSIVQNNYSFIICSLAVGEGLNLKLSVNSANQVIEYSEALGYASPIISSISPLTTISTNGGETLTVVGYEFGASINIIVGIWICPIKFSSSTLILCTIPAGQSADLSVYANAKGGASAISSLKFSYPAPFINSISPTSAASGSSTSITVVGSNFGLTPLVSFQSSIITPAYSTSSLIIFTLPTGEQSAFVSTYVGNQSSNFLVFHNVSSRPPSGEPR